MAFTPKPDCLMPELTARQELVLLARTLWREGYNDHLAGHITCNLGDGTMLCNPWLLTWPELRPSDVLRIDLAGQVVEGDWPVPLGIPLHLALHELRSDVTWAVHNHPLYGTVWADMMEVPPILDQSSSLGGGELVVVNEYGGGVNDPGNARQAIALMGGADMALLAGHGVLITGGSARAVHQRSVALEQRCQRALLVRAAGSSAGSVLPDSWLAMMQAGRGEGFIGFWEAAVRDELRRDPGVLDDR
jgi:L-ribulose-5-phosphate 4-epimerase